MIKQFRQWFGGSVVIANYDIVERNRRYREALEDISMMFEGDPKDALFICKERARAALERKRDE